MASVHDYSTTAASNNSASPDGAPEGMAPSTVNDVMRQFMANVKGAVTFVASSGTDTYTAVLAPAPTAYASGMVFAVRIGTANTSATPTLNINSLGAKTITGPSAGALVAGDLNGDHLFSYDGTYLRVLNPRIAALIAIEQGLHTIWIPAAAMKPTVSNGCAALTSVETTSGRPDMNVLDFDDAADEHAQFDIAFPKSWNKGTITFRVHHTTTAIDTDGVAWGLQGVAMSDGDTIDVAYGTAVVVTDAYQSTAEDEYVTAVSSAVTIAGTPANADRCSFRIFRDVSDAADTATEDARLLGVELFFTIDAATDA